jgi:hypothetical protein
MKLFKILAFAALAMVSTISAQAGVVYSNMGADGLTDTSSVFNDNADVTSGNLIASGFTTGSGARRLGQVSLVIQALGSPGNKTVSIFSDNGGSPGSSLFTSNSVFVNGKGVYSFGFADTTVLAANTSYWVLPDTNLTWAINDDSDVPTAINGSGYTFLAAKSSINGGSTWSNTDGAFTLSLNVPEPALTSLLCFGGIALIRRRMKK